MKNRVLLPLAAILIASPAWARQPAPNKSGITFNTTALSFNGSSGNVSSQPISITVTGSRPVTVTSVSFSNSTFFAPVPSLPVTLSPGQRFTGQVSAHPQSTAQKGTLTFASTAGTFTVSLSETATAPKVAAHSVNLTWDAPASNSNPVDSYQVDRAVSGSTQFALVGTTTASSTAFTDSSVTAGQSYVYEVRAVDDSGNASNPSNSVTLAIP